MVSGRGGGVFDNNESDNEDSDDNNGGSVTQMGRSERAVHNPERKQSTF